MNPFWSVEQALFSLIGKQSFEEIEVDFFNLLKSRKFDEAVEFLEKSGLIKEGEDFNKLKIHILSFKVAC